MFFFGSEECGLGKERQFVFDRKRSDGGGGGGVCEEGLLLPLASVTSATCRKVKRSAF